MIKRKKLILATAIALTCSIYSASAQLYVHVRPVVPVIIRTEQPGPRHVWVGEDWTVRDGVYVHTGGHWAEPPREGYHYNQGHWDHDKRGHSWHEGGWHEGGERREGEHHH